MSLSLSEVLMKFRTTHGLKYCYDKVEYINSCTKVIIICPVHGEFLQQPRAHCSGQGCPKCTQTANWSPGKKDTAYFINRAIEKHGQKYDYTNTNYAGNSNELIVTCKLHGDFSIKANSHLNGRGCPKCSNNKKKTNDQFISEAIEVHGNLYDYSKVQYLSATKNIKILCFIHGEFEQSPSNHLSGKGCPKCGVEKSSLSNKKSCCLKYNNLEIVINDHLQNDGHSSCEQHDLQQFVKDNYIGEIICNDRKTIGPYEIDIYIPKLNLGIEMNGNFYHSFNKPETPEEKNKHYHKHRLCIKHGIKLLQFTDYEWNNKRDIVKSMILHHLGISKKIHARSCIIVDKVPDSFFNDNHIAGYKYAKHTFGLVYGGDLVAAMSFSTHNKYSYEICRLATKTGHCVTGGAAKLFKHFIKEINPDTVMTYADGRFSVGNVYLKLGFKLIAKTKPNYSYLDNKMRPHSRIKFQKHKLPKLLKQYDSNLTESENMLNNGYRRLEDVGHYKLLYNK